MDAQVEISQWLGQFAELLPFGYAFGAGMVSAVNPCGFAMLPIYLTLYLGAEDGAFREKPLYIRLFKAIWIALAMTAGFGLLFGVFGVLVSAGGSFIMDYMPVLSALIGAFLFCLGIWLLLGKGFTLHSIAGFAEKIGDPRRISTRGFFLFGLAFGASSLSCTFPVFLLVVGSSVTAGNFVDGLLQFVSYILGMGSIMLLLTLGIAVVKEGIVVSALRRILPYVQKISAVFLILAGGYILYYWTTSGLLFAG